MHGLLKIIIIISSSSSSSSSWNKTAADVGELQMTAECKTRSVGEWYIASSRPCTSERQSISQSTPTISSKTSMTDGTMTTQLTKIRALQLTAICPHLTSSTASCLGRVALLNFPA